MKFQRFRRYGKIDITARKLRAIEKKPARDRKKQAEKMPLLADLLPPALPANVEQVIEARQAQSDAFERDMRARNARTWRESRRDYFAAGEQTRFVIRDAWRRWTGPRTCGYFRYVVDLHTGVMEARCQKYQKAQAESLARIKALSEATGSLF
ncbi:hypothetical protein ACQHIH_21325 (plasmid) [Xanthomonas sontii]|uniref:hypothetical protein n=1 Tax=Xanthomonas sontii TaxID=2650745 RepID=UPI003F83DA6E